MKILEQVLSHTATNTEVDMTNTTMLIKARRELNAAGHR
jgi:hypothetical protein